MTTTAQAMGQHRGYVPNLEQRATWRRAGGAKEKAIIMVEVLETRGGRSTYDLCCALEVKRHQLNTITDVAKRFVRTFENGNIRALRDDLDKLLFRYWLLFEPGDNLRAGLDPLMRMLSCTKTGIKIMDVVSAQSLSGDDEASHNLLRNIYEGVKRVIEKAAFPHLNRLMPGAIAEAALNNTPPSAEDLGIEPMQPSNEFDRIWDIARGKRPPEAR
jgi:hypothetical protein